MIRVAVGRVEPGEVDRLRSWMRELSDRTDEVRQTFEQEGTRAEQVHLVDTSEGPLMIYVMDVEDPDAARRAYANSTMPIDQQHREVMATVVTDRVVTELLLDVTLDSRA